MRRLGVYDLFGILVIVLMFALITIQASKMVKHADRSEWNRYDKSLRNILLTAFATIGVAILWFILQTCIMGNNAFSNKLCRKVELPTRTSSHELNPIMDDDTYLLVGGNKVYFLLDGKMEESEYYTIEYDAKEPYIERVGLTRDVFIKTKTGYGPLITSDWGSTSRTEFHFHLTDGSDVVKQLNTL